MHIVYTSNLLIWRSISTTGNAVVVVVVVVQIWNSISTIAYILINFNFTSICYNYIYSLEVLDFMNHQS